MRLPQVSILGIIKLGLLLTLATDQLFVTANHRSRTAPGQDDNDFGRGLGLPKKEYEGVHHNEYEHITSKALRFKDENIAIPSPARNSVPENGNRRQLNNKPKRLLS